MAKSARTPSRVKNPTRPAEPPQPVHPEIERMKAEQREAFDRWDLFAEQLRRSAGLAEIMARGLDPRRSLGRFDSEIAGAAIVLVEDAVAYGRLDDLRGDPSAAYAVHAHEAAWKVADRVLGRRKVTPVKG